MQISWKPYLVLALIVINVAMVTGGWFLLETGKCVAMDCGDFKECSEEVLSGGNFIFLGEDYDKKVY